MYAELCTSINFSDCKDISQLCNLGHYYLYVSKLHTLTFMFMHTNNHANNTYTFVCIQKQQTNGLFHAQSILKRLHRAHLLCAPMCQALTDFMHTFFFMHASLVSGVLMHPYCSVMHPVIQST